MLKSLELKREERENRHDGNRAKRHRYVDLYRLIRTTAASKYSKEQIIKAARTYLVHGTYSAVERELGIPYPAIKRWANKDWWPILLEEIKILKMTEMDGQYTNIITKALAAVLDRLENGDEVVVGKEIQRKKVSARDAALISAIAFDKRQILRGDPTQIQQYNFNIDDKLQELQNTFEQIAQRADSKVINGEVEYSEIKESLKLLPNNEEEIEDVEIMAS